MEEIRLEEDRTREKNWKRWGPYLAERMWGTVREDYSENGDCWNYLPHDHARSRAYRWGEDGLLGITDRQCRVCFSFALWNEKDPILKERLFGLNGPEGNHGEDVKEHYFYLRSLPTHSYMKGLYKYPQSEFPYSKLVQENRTRSRQEPEYELQDTGAFANDAYWDVFAEYAKRAPNNLAIKLTIVNRSTTKESSIHVLPTLWHRNTWTYQSESEDGCERARIHQDRKDPKFLRTWSRGLGNYVLKCNAFEKDYNFKDKLVSLPEWIFTENDTNNERLFQSPNETPYVKDAFHSYIIDRESGAVNPDQVGSKAAAVLRFLIPPGGSVEVNLELFDENEETNESVDAAFTRVIKEHDEFYSTKIPAELCNEEVEACLQGFAGLLWSKQFYYLVINDWIKGDPGTPPPPHSRFHGRNHEWNHLFNRDVISMPDKWEYPWYAVWDLAFHTVSLALVDIEFAKSQLGLFLREWYMHPNGCLPAYEFAFGDVNPPVHAWACWRVYKLSGDTTFLQSVFQKLIINFTWWVNRKDLEGHNLFSGGFLGLEYYFVVKLISFLFSNIGVFDRSKPLPTGGNLRQADGTSWMAFYCLYMLKIALELAYRVDPVYDDMASKFFEHFLLIAEAMNAVTDCRNGLWDAEDQFYYDSLMVNGQNIPLKVRSVVGLTPLFATGIFPRVYFSKMQGFAKRTQWFMDHRKDLSHQISMLECQDPTMCTPDEYMYLLSIPKEQRIKGLLEYLYDESEFLSDFGIRSLSKFHQEQPYVFDGHRVDYVPGESDSYMFGGNSNWRGPIWFPMNYLLILALRKLYSFYGKTLSLPFPAGSKRTATTEEAAFEIMERLASLFLPDENGSRPCHGGDKMFSSDTWKDYIYFYEHFHGDTGRGLGASHQTGWTALVVNVMFELGRSRAKALTRCGDQKLKDQYYTFDISFWTSFDFDKYPRFDVDREKYGFKTIAEMMETYFHKQPWKYRNLVSAMLELSTSM